MEAVLIYVCMVVVGAVWAIVYCNPTGEIANSSYAAKYPLLGVLVFFGFMAALYLLLTIAEKNVWDTYFGFLTLMISFGVTRQIFKNLKRKK